MQKKSLIVITLCLVLVIPSIGIAQTANQTSDLQALVQQLQAQIKELQKQVVSLQTQLTTTKEEIAEVKAELGITRSLERGAVGDEVKKLQEFLKKFPDIYPSGLVTGYFGPQTELAVKKLQEKQGIEAIGIVGPKTIAKINELLTESAGVSNIIPPGLVSAPGLQNKVAKTSQNIVPIQPATTTIGIATSTPATSEESSTTTTPYVAPVQPAIISNTIQETTQTTPTVAYGSALNLSGVSDLFLKIWSPASNGIALGGGLGFSTQAGVGWSQQYGGKFVTSYSMQGAEGQQYITSTSSVAVTVSGPNGSVIEVWDLESLRAIAITNGTNGTVTFTAEPNHRYGGFAWYADNGQRNITIYTAYASLASTTTTAVGSPPPAPSVLYIISGGTTPSTGTSYSYSVQVYKDSDGDEVKPIFDWGDGTTFEWSSFMNPPVTGGTTAQTSKTWTSAGTFAVKAKVKDATGRESGWGPVTYLTVSGNTITPPVFTVTSPNGGEEWKTGETKTITWTAGGTSVSTVNVELYKSGNYTGMLGYNVANNGSLNWTVSSSVNIGSDYKVRIYNPSSLYYSNFDESNNSFSIVAPADTTPPEAPASIGASATTSTKIYLQWQTSTDNIGVSGYKIYRDGSYLTSVAPLSYANSFTDTGLSPSTTYSYTVAAYDAAGNVSSQSSIASATTQSVVMPPAAPSDFNLTSNNGSSIGLRWVDNSGDETEFKIERRFRPNFDSEVDAGPWSEIGSAPANGTTYTDSNFPVSGTYDYRVKACNSAGCSATPNGVNGILMQKSAMAPSAITNMASVIQNLSEILLRLKSLLR